MVPVDAPPRDRDCTPGRRGHLACGVAGLGVVLALFLSTYAAIVAFAEGTLGVLASTAIVWLFITAWFVVWLGMDTVLVRRSQRRSDV